jgi:hypothetical protein
MTKAERMTEARNLMQKMFNAAVADDVNTLRIIGFLPYTSFVTATHAQPLQVYEGIDDQMQPINIFEMLWRAMVSRAEMNGIEMLFVAAAGLTPVLDNKIVFLVIFEGKLEFFGFKDGNLWRGQGISGDHLPARSR